MEKTYRILKLLIWVLLFAVLIAGAWVLYTRLSAGMEPDSFVELVPQTSEAAEAPEQDPAAPEDTNATEPTEPEKMLAPDFTVYDLDGNAYRLSDFQGKPVILNFWASWCGPCKSEMPEFQNFYDNYGEEVHFLMVNLTDGYQETKESASAYIAKQGHTFPVYYDTAMEAAIAYGVNAVPVTYFIDAEGYFVAAAQGALSASRLQRGVDMLLGNAQ